jgi:transposase
MNIQTQSKRLDHLGIISGVIDDLNLVGMIDEHIGCTQQENVSVGESVKAMIINGLGFSDRPISLMPQFFENCPMDLLFRPGVTTQHFNRHKIGRDLDRIADYGTEALFGLLAMESCKRTKTNLQTIHMDTTTFSLTGAYERDSDEHEISVTYGYSKAHRPDLKQVVLETVVTQDGDIPILLKTWDGNSSDNTIMKERAKKLMTCLKNQTSDFIVVADSKLYHKDNADNLKALQFITRIPQTLKESRNLIQEASDSPIPWQEIDAQNEMKVVQTNHYGIAQRWVVIRSEQAQKRQLKTLEKTITKEREAIDKSLYHLNAKTFGCEKDARDHVKTLTQKWKYHKSDTIKIKSIPCFRGKGRPQKGQNPEYYEYKISTEVSRDQIKIEEQSQQRSCFVIGTNVSENKLKDSDILQEYKKQGQVERGFRFLKEPSFFVSSLYLKNPKRITALLMVMTLALLVYSIAERCMRKNLQDRKETLPNQIDIQIQTPTLRWIFQMMCGVNIIQLTIDEKIMNVFDGLTDLRKKILKCFSPGVQKIYGITC